jgi:ParB family chromosome partitioning protein
MPDVCEKEGDVLLIPLKKIKVSKEWNARTKYEDIDELAKSISEKGQLTPVIVTHNKKSKEPFFLVAGFRRYEALKKNKATHVLGIVKEYDKKEAFEINLLENLARDSLTTYEIAKACMRLKDDYKMTGPKIAEMLSPTKGMSANYVNNLTRALGQLHPKIIKAWSKGNPVCTIMNLNQWASWKGDPDKQLEEFEIACGKVEGPNRDDVKEGKYEQAKRPNMTQLRRAIAVIKDYEPEPYIDGLMNGLRFASGSSKVLKHGAQTIFNPKNKKEKEGD